MSLAVELWRALEAWDAAKHPRGPGGRFIKAGGGGGGSGRPSLADAIRGTAANGPKRQRGDKSGMTVGDAVRAAAKRSDSTGTPTQRTPAEHRAQGAHDVADAVDRALAEQGVPEVQRRAISEAARAAANAHGERTPRGRTAPPKPTAPAPSDADVARAKVEAAKTDVRRAVDELAPNGGSVRLSAVRNKLGERHNRRDVDTALDEMFLDDGVVIGPESNQKTLTQADRDAAVRIGGQDQHQIQIRPRTNAAPSPAPAPNSSAPTPAGKPRRGARLDGGQLADLEGRLSSATSMDQAREHLAGLTVPQLRQVAEHAGVSLGSGDTKARALDRIVNSVVGRRLDSAAIGRMVNR
jgi:hypothetical protein